MLLSNHASVGERSVLLDAYRVVRLLNSCGCSTLFILLLDMLSPVSA